MPLRLSGKVNLALQTPLLRDRLLNADSVPTGGSSAELAWQMTIESDSNARIVTAA